MLNLQKLHSLALGRDVRFNMSILSQIRNLTINLYVFAEVASGLSKLTQLECLSMPFMRASCNSSFLNFLSNLTKLDVARDHCVAGDHFNAQNITSLTRLTSLNCPQKTLNDDNLQHLTNLKHLKFNSANGVTNKSLTLLTSLERLEANNNQINDQLLSHLFKLSHLNIDNIFDPAYTFNGLKTLTNLTHLEYHQDPLEGQHFNCFPYLTFLSIDGKKFNGSLIKSLSNLTHLSLSRFVKSDTLPRYQEEVLKELQHNPELIHLSIPGYQIGHLTLSKLPNLTFLNADGSQLKKESLEYLTNLKNYNMKDVITTTSLEVLQSFGVVTLRIFKNLDEVKFVTNIKGSELKWLTGIRKLDLDANRLIETMHLTSLTNLEILSFRRMKNSAINAENFHELCKAMPNLIIKHRC